MPPAAEAVTLDFFNTLAFHRDGRGRGRLLMEYLELHGLQPDPWEHDVLYDVFESHEVAYSPTAPHSERLTYYSVLASRVFERLGISDSPSRAAEHAEPLWEILGPSSFSLFADTLPTLKALRERGVPVAVVSNWQSGLSHFCTELGLTDYVDHVLSSADLGVEKPDPRIFLDACSRLGIPPRRTLHVGDTHLDDYVGGSSAGLQVVLIDRTSQADAEVRKVHALTDILDFVRPAEAGQAPAT